MISRTCLVLVAIGAIAVAWAHGPGSKWVDFALIDVDSGETATEVKKQITDIKSFHEYQEKHAGREAGGRREYFNMLHQPFKPIEKLLEEGKGNVTHGPVEVDGYSLDKYAISASPEGCLAHTCRRAITR